MASWRDLVSRSRTPEALGICLTVIICSHTVALTQFLVGATSGLRLDKSKPRNIVKVFGVVTPRRADAYNANFRRLLVGGAPPPRRHIVRRLPRRGNSVLKMRARLSILVIIDRFGDRGTGRCQRS